jgi:D-proline reductase (dithiol) PrdB
VLHKPLAECRAVLITTAGIHLRSQQPFDMENKDGDATYREIPATTQMDELTITHDYYDHKDADRDPNVVFPLVRFRELVGLGVIGGLAPRHFGLMGHTEGEQLTRLTRRSAPDVATKLRKDGVDFAFLTPA